MHCIALHIGVGSHPSEHHAEALKALMRRACAAAGDALGNTAAAACDTPGDPTSARLLTACEQALLHLEDSGLVNAGRGSNTNADGHREGDACIVTSGGALGCVCASHGDNPIAEAVALARGATCPGENPHPVMRVPTGVAKEVKAAKGAKEAKAESPAPPPAEGRESRGEADTVGVVVAAGGAFAAAVSSGGIASKVAGRVGEAGHPGAGCWASERCAAALSGRGEDAMRELLAARLCFAQPGGSGGVGLEQQHRGVVGQFIARHASPCGGVLLSVDPDARAYTVTSFYNTQAFGVAFADSEGARGEVLLRRPGLAANEWCSTPAFRRLHTLSL